MNRLDLSIGEAMDAMVGDLIGFFQLLDAVPIVCGVVVLLVLSALEPRR